MLTAHKNDCVFKQDALAILFNRFLIQEQICKVSIQLARLSFPVVVVVFFNSQ